MHTNMKICILGCGKAAELLLPYLKYFQAAQVLFVDKDIKTASKLAKAFLGTSEATNELPTSGIDFAIICTPSGLHIEHAKHFLEMGAKVFVEKPPALAKADILWLDEHPDAWITVGYQARFSSAVLAIQKEFSNPILVSCWKYRGRSASYYTDWHGKLATDGGVLAQQGVHCVDLVCSLSEEPPKAIHFWGKNARHNIECEDTALLSIAFPTWTAQIQATTALQIYRHLPWQSGLRVVSESGLQEIGGNDFEKIIHWPTKLTTPALDTLSSRERMWKSIADAVVLNGSPPLAAHKTTMAMKVIHAAYSGGKYGEWCEGLGKGSIE